MEHSPGHKTSFHKFQKVEITQSIFSNQNGIKFKINNKKKLGKFTNLWKFKITHINNRWVKEEITREIKKYFEINEENTTYQNV